MSTFLSPFPKVIEVPLSHLNLILLITWTRQNIGYIDPTLWRVSSNPFIYMIFNNTMQTGIYPDVWKLATYHLFTKH